jgi:hypothetical protein
VPNRITCLTKLCAATGIYSIRKENQVEVRFVVGGKKMYILELFFFF